MTTFGLLVVAQDNTTFRDTNSSCHARHSRHQPEKPSVDVELILNHAVFNCF
jgi:hypothetical protein